MGRYINQTSDGEPITARRKVRALLVDGAEIIPEPTEWVPNLVCVVDNGMFEAAGYAFDEHEMNVFKAPDLRKKVWMIHPKAADIADK